MQSIRPTRVQLLVTCLIDQFFPDTGMSVATLLEGLGLKVEVPLDQTCCGQPAFNAGFTDEARSMARHTIDVLSASHAPIVVPSGSCGDMMIHHYAALLRDDPNYGPRATALAARTHELTKFLVDVLGVTDVGATAAAAGLAGRGRVTYHACCHGLRGLGVKEQPQRLMDGIAGLDQCPLAEADTCCGFGGLFSVKMSDISSAMLARKLDHIQKSGAETVVVTDVSCAMHMNGGLRRRGSAVQVRHLAELLSPPPEQPVATPVPTPKAASAPPASPEADVRSGPGAQFILRPPDAD
jgi:L-lactate dehydrogenase complex protein LldE